MKICTWNPIFIYVYNWTIQFDNIVKILRFHVLHAMRFYVFKSLKIYTIQFQSIVQIWRFQVLKKSENWAGWCQVRCTPVKNSSCDQYSWPYAGREPHLFRHFLDHYLFTPLPPQLGAFSAIWSAEMGGPVFAWPWSNWCLGTLATIFKL